MVSAISLILLLQSMLILAFHVQPVRAAGTIYIRSDGSIDPPSAPIQRDGNTYVLTGNITPGKTDGIVIERSNIVIDGSGYTIWGNYNYSYSGRGVDISNVQNVTIKKMNIGNFTYGISLYEAFYNKILENNVTENGYIGIEVFSSNNNIVSRNHLTKNAASAVSIDYSSYNTLSANSIVDNDYLCNGITLGESNDNIVSGNNIIENSDGISLFTSCSNVISRNFVSNNRWTGIGLYYSSDNNTVAANTITSNKERGLGIAESNSNTIYHNDFVDNANQTYSGASTNVWNDGYPSGGNYWSDYDGTDSHSGSYQNETGSDGIGDTSYIIDVDNMDYFPLMNPYGSLHPALLVGDVNRDGTVDILDLVKIVIVFGSDSTSQAWNPNCDLNGDEFVDILDLALAASHFGETARPLEYLFITKYHVWYNVTGYWAEAAFIISNTGGTDVVLDKITVRVVESSWSNIYYWKTNDITASDDIPVTNVPITGAFNITIQGSARSFSQASGDITLESGYTMVVYISNPDSIGLNDVGLSVSLIVFTANAQYYKETMVQTVQ